MDKMFKFFAAFWVIGFLFSLAAGSLVLYILWKVACLLFSAN
jgi:hypothetical protein